MNTGNGILRVLKDTIKSLNVMSLKETVILVLW